MKKFPDESTTFEVFDDNDFYYDAQTGKKLISLKQASEIYSIPLQTLYKMSSRGKLPKFKIGKRIYINPPEFEFFLDNFHVCARLD